MDISNTDKKNMDKTFDKYSEYRKFFLRSMGFYKWDMDELERRIKKYDTIRNKYPEWYDKLKEEIEEEKEYREKLDTRESVEIQPISDKKFDDLDDQQIFSLIQILSNLLLIRQLNIHKKKKK